MAKNNKEYWEGRAEALSSPIWKKTDKVNKELEKIYRQSVKEIQQELGEWISKYQSKHGLDAESMKKIMDTKESANFRYTVKEYMEKIKELGDSKEAEALLKEFNIMAGKVRFQRYEELEAQMQYQALKLSQSTQNIVREHLTEIIPEVYTRSIFEIQKGIGIGASFNQINPMTIESIINTPWNTKNFSGRIWDNKSVLIQNLRRTILGGVMQGQEFKRMSQQLQKQMGGEFYKARRILETETTYVLEKAKEESYNELGIENYIFIATLDNRTSEACQKMDGKVFRNKDRLLGINVPPLHPFCRSALAPYVEGLEDATRIARADSGETYKVPANMTYEEWLKKYPGDGIIKENKEAKNLRKNADKIKSKIKDIGVKGVVDIPPKGMKDFTIDFDDYHINVERNHDITRKEAIKFILDSDLSLSKWEGRFINYYGAEGSVFVDTENKIMRTAFKEKQFDKKTKEIMEVLNEVKKNGTVPNS